MRTNQLLVLLAATALPVLADLMPDNDVVSSTADDAIPQDYIDKVLAYFKDHPLADGVDSSQRRDLSNEHHGLQKRQRPADQGCDHPDQWLERVCMSDIGPRAWMDECHDPHDDDPYEVDGECPELTYCSEATFRDGEHEIRSAICVPATPPKTDNADRKRKRQYGYRTVASSSKSGVTETTKSVRIESDIPSGSVSGHVRSTDRHFIIKPSNILTANLRGYDFNLCKSDAKDTKHHNTRMCQTTHDYNFKTGNYVDFSFGLSQGQSGILFYSIISA